METLTIENARDGLAIRRKHVEYPHREGLRADQWWLLRRGDHGEWYRRTIGTESTFGESEFHEWELNNSPPLVSTKPGTVDVRHLDDGHPDKKLYQLDGLVDDAIPRLEVVIDDMADEDASILLLSETLEILQNMSNIIGNKAVTKRVEPKATGEGQ